MRQALTILLMLLLASCSGQPQKTSNDTKSCYANFTENSPGTICGWYWENFLPECDSRMRDEMTRRRLVIHPRSECGNIISSSPTPSKRLSNTSDGSNQCTIDASNLSTTSICNAFWENLSVPCDPKFKAELEKRGVSIYRKADCGKPLAARPAQIDERALTCDATSIINFSTQSIKNLCQTVHAGGDCKNVARQVLNGQLIAIGRNDAACGRSEAGNCSAIIQNIKNSNNPVSAACSIRNDKTSVEGLRCRSTVNGYLLSQGKSSGILGGQCGRAIQDSEIDIIKRSN